MLEFPDTPLKQSAARLGFRAYEERSGEAGNGLLIVAECGICHKELVLTFSQSEGPQIVEALERFLNQHREGCRAILSSLKEHRTSFHR